MNVHDPKLAAILKSNDVSNWYRYDCPSGPALHPSWWSEGRDDEEELQLLEKRTATKQIIHRMFWKNKEWNTYCVTIQDPAMREVLDEVLDVKDLDLIEYTFYEPYAHVCHKWKDLQVFHNETTTVRLKTAATALLNILQPLVAPSLQSIAEIRETGKVQCKDIWQLFPVGTFVSTEYRGVRMIACITSCRGLRVDYKFVDWNGSEIGYGVGSTLIDIFNGIRRVNQLPIFPISFLEDEKGFRESMIERGRKFEEIAMNGWMYRKAHIEEPLVGKVCVDPYAYYDVCKIPKPALQPLPQSHADNEDSSELTDEQCMLAKPWLISFDLEAKNFCELRIDQLKPYSWNEEAFQKLVLPSETKMLIWEFFNAQRNISRNKDFDDFIVNKGRGLIMLMHGPPGVGKTFTAETVAEKAHAPLYIIGSDSLGTDVQTITASLGRALTLCTRWDGMLLLDEADVYMAARNPTTLAQNELVSLFLRKLEYYPGPLALTTNRLQSIDKAFLSRVDLPLPYFDLTPESRREVWNNFIDRAGRHHFDITEEALETLSGYKLDGREIKSLIKLSMKLLAANKGTKIPMERIDLLAKMRLEAGRHWKEGNDGK
ncbi:P-loop containing nucleoside triphosphate hydrolase protein [Xylariaceae sp. FL0255]|nr:P-loop containing nucleoside triphosphate hydrolase protein [Xylariaceae sp. FL0255]